MTPNPHELVASGGLQTSRGGYGGPRRGGGRSSGSGRGIQQSWSRGGGNPHINLQQQQQHPRPPPKPLTANFGLGGPFDGGTNAGGWPQEGSPPSPDGSGPHCERCGRKGHVARICRAPSRFEGICDTCGQYDHRMRYCIRNQSAPHAHIVAALVPPPALSAPAFFAPPTGDSGYNTTTGAYGYGGGDGSYSGGPYDHGGHGHGNYEAVSVGQSPGAGAGAGHDIPSRPPGAPDGGYHRAMQQAGNGGDGVAFAAEDGGHEDEGYFDGPLSSVFGGPESSHGRTAYVRQLPTSGRSSGTGCDIPRYPPQYSGSNNGYGTNRSPQQQYGSGSRSYRAKPVVRHYRGGDGAALWPQQQHGPRPFCSFGWEQRGACRDGPSVNGLANSIAQGKAQRDV